MSKELINIISQGEQLVVSSREVAENFGKAHRETLRKIDNLIEDMGCVQNCTDLFIPSEYSDIQGKTQREYLLTRDGFTLLAMRFTGAKALTWQLKYIDAFNKMETYIKENQKPALPQDYLSALKALVASEEEKAILKPKAEYYDEVLQNESLITITDIAKDLKLTSGSKLNKMLESWGVLYSQKNSKGKHKKWVVTAKYSELGLTHSKTTSNGEGKNFKHDYWTEVGRQFIIDKYKECGLI